MTAPDDTGFSDFFRREFERLVRTAYLVLHDQQSAEDVAQDAFGQLYAELDEGQRVRQPAGLGATRRDPDGGPTGPTGGIPPRPHPRALAAPAATWARPRPRGRTAHPPGATAGGGGPALLRGPVGRGGRQDAGLLSFHCAHPTGASPHAARRNYSRMKRWAMLSEEQVRAEVHRIANGIGVDTDAHLAAVLTQPRGHGRTRTPGAGGARRRRPMVPLAAAALVAGVVAAGAALTGILPGGEPAPTGRSRPRRQHPGWHRALGLRAHAGSARALLRERTPGPLRQADQL